MKTKMKATRLACPMAIGAVAILLSATALVRSESTEKPDEPSLQAARERAGLVHEIYAATLETMHHRYFNEDRAVVPARAMEDIFARIRRQSQVDARWISVNTKPMSIGHEPKTDFEKQAAKEIAAGKEQVEIVEDGHYRRVGAIPLTGACIRCHDPFSLSPTAKVGPKYAGLVISVPIGAGEVEGDSDQEE